ncbi:branched-chain amino acid:cation transporter, LIVCS family [Alkalithermobacter thermoalcaliphilus JW-YL-7 = DSM 7308]|uniref:Branched-chain amino acid transport system carrier protein n=1 Tax=Alkalithermobacter thermoalcaliphilus JW-YL-7 = DSM 7308 TaxID=1121328 RepID=A0A150FRT5_CLOPD|nr:branched-chain amino acid transport system II carrier protein [[Clostridium] paradoxum JW-YL-7 = DSM 7308]SHK37602.1 branched-chain amino acid:cation transporter, LIVCS family [[Clostridium] paradoxum JW-YL-7 = DSM 7308]
MIKKISDVVIVGFALFAMFFGAGNLIFPPFLGFISGDRWLVTFVGFFLTGICMPLLGIVAVSKAGGRLSDLADKVSPTFSKILGTIIMLALGPLLAIPRTGATTFEMGIKPIFPNFSPIVASIIYFFITYILVIKPSSVIDTIGKFLTPTLLIILSVIIFKGATNPIGDLVNTGIENPFSTGFTEGYQTMDALGSIVIGGIIIKTLVSKGYTKKDEQIKLAVMSAIVAALGLTFVYGGLMYLGSTASEMFDFDISKTELTIQITNAILGNAGKVAIGIAVSLACLTTSIGLTATCGEFFNSLTNGKLSYKSIVTVIIVFSTIISNFGVEKIVGLAIPLLVTVYPVVIILIIMNLFDRYIPNKAVYPGAVIGAVCISIFEALSAAGVRVYSILDIIKRLPLSDQGFSWIAPALLGALFTGIVGRKKHNY